MTTASSKPEAELGPKYKGLLPGLIARLVVLEALMRTKGHPVVLVSGFRSWADQDALYAQGRTTPGRKVTAARGGDSWHNHGKAADYWFLVNGKPVCPSAEDPRWDLFGRCAKEAGLEWGGDWIKLVDKPHVQWRNGYTIKAARKQAMAARAKAKK